MKNAIKTIKAGYQIHFETWENDADDYRTQVVSGLTKEDVDFYLDLASRFTSRNWPPEGGFGNGSISNDDLIGLVDELLKKHPDVSRNLHDDWDSGVFTQGWNMPFDADVADYLYDALCDNVLGYPVSEYYMAEGMFCRVMDSWKVFTVPVDLIDVSDQFRSL